MQEKKKKMTLMQSLCAFSYPRACYRLLSLIRTLGLLRRYFVDYRLPPPHLGSVGTRHAESVPVLVIGHGMPCPYHSLLSLNRFFGKSFAIRSLDLRSKVLSLLIAKLMPALFCYYHTLYYLCMRHQGCMADIGLAENIPSTDLNRVVPA